VSFGGPLALFMIIKLCACISSDASNLCLKVQCAKLDQLYLHLRTCEHIQMWPCEHWAGLQAQKDISISIPLAQQELYRINSGLLFVINSIYFLYYMLIFGARKFASMLICCFMTMLIRYIYLKDIFINALKSSFQKNAHNHLELK